MDYFPVLHHERQEQRARALEVVAVLAQDGHLLADGSLGAEPPVDPRPALREMVKAWYSVGGNASDVLQLTGEVISRWRLSSIQRAHTLRFVEVLLAEVLPPAEEREPTPPLASLSASMGAMARAISVLPEDFPAAPPEQNPFRFHVAWLFDCIVEQVHRVSNGGALSESVRQLAEIEQGAPRQDVLGVLQLRALARERLPEEAFAPLEGLFEKWLHCLARDIIALKGGPWVEHRDKDEIRFSLLLQRILLEKVAPGDHLQLVLAEQALSVQDYWPMLEHGFLTWNGLPGL